MSYVGPVALSAFVAVSALVAADARFAASPESLPPLGAEFLVNSSTPGPQGRPAVAATPEGRFLVVWETLADGLYEIRGRLFSPDGIALGVDFPVSEATAASQSWPDAAAGGAGEFIVAWDSREVDGSGVGIAARRLDRDGNPLGGEFAVNTDVVGDQTRPRIAASSQSQFVVAWRNDAAPGGTDISARLFTLGGLPKGDEFVVNSLTSASQIAPAVAMAPDGSFVVTWMSEGADGDGYGVRARQFSANGGPFGEEFGLNDVTTGYQGMPAIEWLAGGRYLAVWVSCEAGDFGCEVRARSVERAAPVLSDEHAVGAFNPVSLHWPRIAPRPDGRAVITWDGDQGDGAALGVLAAVVDGGGLPLTAEEVVNEYLTGDQFRADLGINGPGYLLVAWQCENGDDSSYGIRGRAFSCGIYCDGFESGDTLRWSRPAGEVQAQ
ncbi:MAG: hypothetical protein M5U13_13615 [Thermoanaerobaculia bacterium]|nr:hypothetical protein [Thermoanaerobaculia bacterium]